MIGTLISGRFRIDERIGSGGMSTVYRAFDEKLERPVAIKLMHSEIAAQPDQLERFRREARAVAQLSHPNIVMAIDAGEDEDRPYIVFEYVDGETLKDRIRREGPLPVGEAVAYAVEIGRALSAAHAERLVHRDVKPQNTLIAPSGRAKVTDFGIARSLEADRLTMPGRVLGTTDYVSPEQAMGEQVTQQSDVYSLGVCLYEMLSGEVPYRADTHVAVATKHVREPMPDVRARRPEVSASLAAVLERATAKDTASRYPNAQSMVDDLQQALAIEAARAGQTTGEATTVLQGLSPDTAELAPLRLRNPRRVLGASVLVLLLGAGVIAGLATRGESGTPGGAAPGGSGDLQPVRFAEAAAHDYDPPPDGDGRESANDARNAIDGEQPTLWSTERYSNAKFGNLKPGVGLYLDAAMPVAARRLDLITSSPGFAVEIYAADSVPAGLGGWTRVSARTNVEERTQIPLDTAGREFRNYLLWIVELPPEGRADVNELTLLR